MSDTSSASSASASAASASSLVEVTAAELEGPGVVFCPNPKMPLWSSHPKVYIDLSHDGAGRCPYCGTTYRLKAGEKLPSGH